VFRAGELGDHHNPEFTMLEWYEVGGNLESEVKLLGTLAAQTLRRDGYTVTTYRQLFVDAFAFDPLEVDLAVLRKQVATVDESLASSLGDDRDRLLDVLLSERIQPMLGLDQPTIVRNYPLSQAALARVSDDDPQCAARFELLADGVEIANGYDELRDCDVLSERFRRANELRVQSGRKPLGPHEQAWVRAISEELPACAGVALGVDRLLMVRTGSKAVAEVMPLTIELA
jgi:lysyl-tRNA synthetase class 2